MTIPSTKDTIGCATEVKQPVIPKINPPMVIRVLGKDHYLFEHDLKEFKKYLGIGINTTIKSMGNHRSRFEKL